MLVGNVADMSFQLWQPSIIMSIMQQTIGASISIMAAILIKKKKQSDRQRDFRKKSSQIEN
jgi:hypothetical protein